MILTRDNILRFVREKKYTTPTIISENFDTTTMIASAALSELAKTRELKISFLKYGGTPYYYDPKQKECLIELARLQYSNYDREIFEILLEKKILADNSLSIQQKLAIERLKDFATYIEIKSENQMMGFWIWFLLDIDKTKKELRDYLTEKQEDNFKEQENSNLNLVEKSNSEIKEKSFRNQTIESKRILKVDNLKSDENEKKIEIFFRENNLKIENKNKENKNILYKISFNLGKIKIIFDCIYFTKKPTEIDVIKFYSISNTPKIIFANIFSQKIIKLGRNLVNITLIGL